MVRNILDYLERSAAQYGDKTAFADDNTTLSFSALTESAKRVGTALARMGSDKLPVGVYMEKTPWAIAAFFGAVYSGRCYSPIDAQMPIKRVEQILKTLDTDYLIVDRDSAPLVRETCYQGRVLLIDELLQSDIDEDLLRRVRRFSIDTDPLYIIFTSGSTGVPKGVVLSHRAVIDFTEWFSNAAGFDHTCVFGNQAPFYFDMSVKDLYSTIRNGATAWIIPKRLFNFPAELFRYLNEHQINTLAWATSAVCLASNDKAFQKECPRYVRAVCFGGEAMPVKLLSIWQRYLPDTLYMNMYGPTEAAVDCTYHILEKGRDYSSGYYPAGYPCENTGILILDGDRQVQTGEVGEICVRGSALAWGYYNDPVKTAQVFVQNPLQTAYPEKIYRTGDMGYYNEQGEIMFAARKDDQIKHMGYRIELGEIETALGTVGGVERCCCLFDKAADKIVCVYTGSATKKEIILEIKKFIPKYMWPNRFVQLEELPMNLNGKIDRTRLKAEYANG